MKKSKSNILVFGGILSLIASLFHIAIIIGGAEWYRFFGAGEEMATMAENGSIIPTVVTLVIALLLFIWALYAFSGAGLLKKLPLLKTTLVIISTIYLLRGFVAIPIYIIQPTSADLFLVWSSFVSFIYGVSYAVGIKQVWFQNET